jgi:hypothetical protein
MKSALATSRPAPALAFVMWFITLVVGAIPLAALLWFTDLHHPTNAIGLALVSSGFAGFFSLPIPLVLPISLRWVFIAATVEQCCYRLLLSIVGLFAVVTLAACWVLTGGDMADRSFGGFLGFACSYLIAAIVSAAYVYRRWLFRP